MVRYRHHVLHVLLAPPSVLGLWSIALVLWLPIKYYYHCYISVDSFALRKETNTYSTYTTSYHHML